MVAAESTSEIWKRVRELVQERARTRDAEKFLLKVTLQYLDQSKRGPATAHLKTAEAFDAEWIKDNYLDDISDSFKEELGVTTEVEIYHDNQLSLPGFGANQSPIPHAFARSALFGIIARSARDYLEQEVLPSWKGCDFRYTGPALGQTDLDVWLQCLRLMRSHQFGHRVAFHAHGFLKDLDKSTGKSDYVWLDKVFTRLTATALEVRVRERVYVGPLIQEYFREETSGRFVVVLNPKLTVLFQDEQYTRVSLPERLQLRKELSKWLHSYLQGHQATKEKPHFVSVSRLKELSKSDMKKLWRFRAYLRKAMEELDEIGVVSSWEINDKDHLVVVRP